MLHHLPPKIMSTENTPRSPAADASQPLTAIEKLALSRQALQEALYPPAKEKKGGAVSSLRKLWSMGSKAAKSVTAVKIGSSPSKPLVKAGESLGRKSATPSVRKASGAEETVFSDVAAKTGDLLTALLQKRWRKHPANLALQVGEPLLEYEIRKRPFVWLAAAASAGATLVFLHPWKWRQSRRLLGSTVAKEARVLVAGGAVFLFSSLLSEWLKRLPLEKSSE